MFGFLGTGVSLIGYGACLGLGAGFGWQFGFSAAAAVGDAAAKGLRLASDGAAKMAESARELRAKRTRSVKADAVPAAS